MKSRDRYISPAVIRRLPRYLTLLEELAAANVERVSSDRLAELLGVTASQIRQDLNCFGGFGQQGYGYHTGALRSQLLSILKLDRGYTGILIGVGNLGRALCRNFDFAHAGIRLTAAFDVAAPQPIASREELLLLPASELERYVKEQRPAVAVLTLPGAYAQELTQRLADWGIRGIWNFTGTDVLAKGVFVENVHFSDSLMYLCYHLEDMSE